MIVTVLNRRWVLVEDSTALPRDSDGVCDPPCKTGKQIKIRKGLHGERQLEVILHELLHALDWGRAEEHVEQGARDLARVLWRLGYRRE